jgi:hypothetical protein
MVSQRLHSRSLLLSLSLSLLSLSLSLSLLFSTLSVFPLPLTQVLSIVPDMQHIRPTAFGPVPLICTALHQHYLTLTRQYEREEKERRREGEVEGVSKEEEEEAMKERVRWRARNEMRLALGDRLSSVKVTSAPIHREAIEFIR